ncbi:hypothetical protein L1D13_19050 [Vibrio tubiashii]|nr:hypothetical protein [Vibrio tubiashii]MCG9582537.1 hypothetical protein [Vibrio tubiashii]MCG9616128.1 hypothetical protein [Vibrio tubiashii]MCG9689007.1 hypothetical protein [Vibrio tubiashii]
MRAKMIAGILAHSMLSNGIYIKETSEPKAHDQARTQRLNQKHVTNYLP